MDPSSSSSSSPASPISAHILRLEATADEPIAYPFPYNRFARGTAATSSRRSRSRAPSIWSTSSICSEDSLAGNDEDQDDDEDNSTEPESLFSAPSPTSTSCSSWLSSSARSSCADAYSYSDGASLLSVPSSPLDPRFSRSDKPRGPRSRPLPTLPTHRPSSSSSSPTSPLASNSPITASSFAALSIAPSVPSTQLESLQVPVSAPRAREPKSSSRRPRHAVRSRNEKESKYRSFEHSLRIASQEDYIDWERIEEIMCYSDG